MTAGIRVLGPLEAEVEGARADLGGPLQRAVLALLLMERGRVVSVDRMIDQLWRGEPPAQTLGELSAFLGRPQEAARHFAAAQQVARRWNSPHWAARAQAAARQCPPNG
jgi:DNA-binding SARP family transcriptional activator